MDLMIIRKRRKHINSKQQMEKVERRYEIELIKIIVPKLTTTIKVKHWS